MEKNIPLIKILNYFMLWIYVFILVSTYLTSGNAKTLLLFIMIYTIFNMFRFKKSQIIIIFLIFIFTYWFYLIFYFFWDIPYSTYVGYQNFEVSLKLLQLQTIIFVLLFNMISLKIANYSFEKLIVRKRNDVIFLFSIIIMIMINFFGLRGGNFFQVSYGIENTGSTLLEYFLIFNFMAYLYSNTKSKDFIIITINIIYISNLLLYGFRLVAIEMVLVIFILYFENKFKTRWIISVSIVGFFGMTIIGNLRVGIFGEWKEVFGIYNGVLKVNQGDVFQTSAVHIGLIEDRLFSTMYRIKAFLGIFWNVFVFPKYQINETILNQNLLGHKVGGGGSIASYMYFYLGYFGIIILPVFVSRMVNAVFKTSKEILVIYGYFLLVTFPRWYAYSPFIIIKMGFWLMFTYAVFLCVHNLMLKK